jgi:hypothetical protein
LCSRNGLVSLCSHFFSCYSFVRPGMNCPVWPGSTKEFFVFVCSAVRAEVFSFFLLTLSLSFFFLTLLFISIFVSFSKHVTHISYCQKGQSRDHHLFGQLFPLKSYLTRPVKNILFSLYNSIPAAASLLIYIYQNSTYTFNSNFKYCVVLNISVVKSCQTYSCKR